VHPQARYCDEGCRQEVKRWQEWQARLRYRQTELGKANRREQSRRQREKRQHEEVVVSRENREATEPSASVGHAKGDRRDFFPCARPGCYELIEFNPRSPRKRFCSRACCNALRRVLLREAKWKQRLAQQLIFTHKCHCWTPSHADEKKMRNTEEMSVKRSRPRQIV
jgi:hypothetical protein